VREFISELRGVSASNLLMDVPWKLRPATARRPGPHKRTAHLGSAARQWAHVVHPVHPPGVTLRSEHFLPRQALPASARDRSADARYHLRCRAVFHFAAKSGSKIGLLTDARGSLALKDEWV
jgi:hypothetical protein